MPTNRAHGLDRRCRRRARISPTIGFCLAAHLVAGLLSAQPGELDPSFSDDGVHVLPFDVGDDWTDHAYGLVLQPDGKAVVVGEIDAGGGHQDFGIARLTASGEIDLSFGTDGRVTVPFNSGTTNRDAAQAVAIDASGRIVVVGLASVSDDVDFAFARLTASGALDTTFDADGRQTIAFDLGGSRYDVASAVALAANGDIVACGGATLAAGSAMAAVRLTDNGSLEPDFGKRTVSFDTSGTSISDCYEVLVQPDGKILLAGWAGPPSNLAGWAGPLSNYDFAVARLTPEGDLDSSFGGDGRVTVDFGAGRHEFGLGATLDSEGRILVAGRVQTAGGSDAFGLVRLLPSGALDPSFGGDGRVTTDLNSQVDDYAVAVAVQPDGAIVAGGITVGPGGSRDFALVRYRADGSLDPSFNGGWSIIALDIGGSDDDTLEEMALRPGAGGIVAAGTVDRNAPGDTDFVVIQVQDGQVFADGFESGSTAAWSATVP